MKRASVESSTLSLPKNAYNKKGFYDSDGPEGDENWKDDISMLEPGDGVIEDELWSWPEEDGESFYIDREPENKKIVEFRNKKFGDRTLETNMFDKIAA